MRRVSCLRFFALAFTVSLLHLHAAAENPEALLAEGKADAAIAALTQRAASSPNDAEAQNLLCRAYYSVQDWDHAIAAGEKSVQLAPEKSSYHLWLGRAYGEKADASSFFTAAGLARKVRTSFERAVELDGSNVAARSDLAEFYSEAPGIVGGGTDKARAQADALMKIMPAKGHWVLGRLAEKNKDNTSAEREYQAALDARHGDADGWLDMVIFYRRAGRMDDFDNALKKLAAAHLASPEVLVDAAANALRANRNLPQGVELLKRYLAGKMVEDGPAFKAHTILGQIYEKQGNKAGAQSEFRAALMLASGFRPARDGLKRTGGS
jgi:tetratricopeptide (TPR) repeat protein